MPYRSNPQARWILKGNYSEPDLNLTGRSFSSTSTYSSPPCFRLQELSVTTIARPIMANEDSRKKGVEIIPASIPKLSPNHPGINRQNNSRLMIAAENMIKISPPTANCFPLCSS